jgi:hypothetical protein
MSANHRNATAGTILLQRTANLIRLKVSPPLPLEHDALPPYDWFLKELEISHRARSSSPVSTHLTVMSSAAVALVQEAICS